jgi:hypothetical protein
MGGKIMPLKIGGGLLTPARGNIQPAKIDRDDKMIVSYRHPACFLSINLYCEINSQVLIIIQLACYSIPEDGD